MGALLACASAILLAAPVQETGDEPEARTWPKLRKAQRDAVSKTIGHLTRIEMEDEDADRRILAASAKIVAVGRGAAPVLMASLSRRKSLEAEDARRIVVCLDALVEPADGVLLAEEFGSRRRPLRLWALSRAASFDDAALLPAFRGLLEHEDGETALRAALGCLRAGSLDGWDPVVAAARSAWRRRGPELRAAFERVRSPEAEQRALRLLAAPANAGRVTGLRILGGTGTRDGAPQVLPYLDNQDAAVKEAAINALRGMVDGAPPLVNISAFDLIGRADAWRKRLRG